MWTLTTIQVQQSFLQSLTTLVGWDDRWTRHIFCKKYARNISVMESNATTAVWWKHSMYHPLSFGCGFFGPVVEWKLTLKGCRENFHNPLKWAVYASYSYELVILKLYIISKLPVSNNTIYQPIWIGNCESSISKRILLKLQWDNTLTGRLRNIQKRKYK